MEEEFFGEGEANESGTESAFQVGSTLKNTMCDEDIVDTLFKNCGGTAVDKVRLSTLLHYLKTTSQVDEDFEELRVMFGYGFDDAWIELDDFRDVMLKYIEGKRDWDVSTAPDEHEDDGKLCTLAWSPDRKRMSAITSMSSPGILDLSNMANCSFGSLEGTGGDISIDAQQLFTENSELVLQLKSLQEKQCKQDLFVAQLEDQAAQQQLQAEMRENKLLSLQEKYDALQVASSEWQVQLEKSEEESRLHKEQIEKLEVEVKEQEIELSQTTAELNRMKASHQELRRDLSSQKTQCEEAELRSNILEDVIEEQATNAVTLEEFVHELQQEITSLRSERTELRNSLLEAKDELFSLQGRMSSAQRTKRPTEDDGYDFNGHSTKKSYTNIVHFEILSPVPSSTPAPRMSSLSINEEIRQVVAVDELFLPSPFCEKAELSNWENVFDESGSQDNPSFILFKDEINEEQFGKDTLQSAIDEEETKRVEFLSLWEIFIELLEAERKAKQLVGTFEESVNLVPSAQYNNEVCNRQVCAAKLPSEETDLKTKMESQEIPASTCVDMLKESIRKKVNTIKDCLSRIQTMNDTLLRTSRGPPVKDEHHHTR